jgi:uncharacterized protein (TIGR02391 family)
MDVADLAGYVVEAFIPNNFGMVHRRTFCGDTAKLYVPPNQGPDHEVMHACAEAWSWLEANGLICPHAEEGHQGWYILTRRGKAAKDRNGVKAPIASQELPEHFLHPEIALRTRSLFLQGRFDTAVLEAFKTVEVEMRAASKLGNELLGTKLASRAFDATNGPLTDQEAEPGERAALQNLMSGALGNFKNPSSHRRVELTAGQARERLIFASHLLGIIDERGSRP